MAAPQIRSIEFVSPDPGPEPRDHSGLSVGLEDGSYSSFHAATPDQPGRLMRELGQDFVFGTPTLFVARMDEPTVGEAVQSMADDMGGYWLRYFNSLGDISERGSLKLAEGRKKKKPKR